MALRPASDAGAHLVAAGLLGRVERQVLDQQRTWPDECHITLQHIEELRQFVDAQRTHQAADACQALVVRQQFAILAAAAAAYGLNCKFEIVKDDGSSSDVGSEE